MRVAHIKIMGFRSISELEIDINQMTAFVGENSAGKSTILQAVYLLLISSSTKVDDLDFHNIPGSVKDEIYIEGTFVDLSENERHSLSTLFGFPLSTITVVKKASKENTKLKTYIKKPKITNKLLDTTYVNGKTKSYYVEAVKNGELPDYFLDEKGKTNISLIKRSIEKYVQENYNNLEFSGETLIEVKPKDLKEMMLVLPDPLYVPAFEDFEKQANPTKTNIFGKLLNQIINDLSSQGNNDVANMDRQLKNITSKFKRNTRSRIKEIGDLENQLTTYVKDILPSNEVYLKFELPGISKLLNDYFSINLYDGISTPVGKKGHGAQRALVWALLRTYLDNISGVSSSKVLFLVEEPELYLHPQSQRVMLEVLNKLSKNSQVLYSTHSSVFVNIRHPENIRLVRKFNKKTQIDQISQNTLNYSKNELRFITWFDDNQSELFFAKSVILVEGDTEKVILQRINVDTQGGKSLDELGCQVIVTGGKFAMPFYTYILSDLNIPFLVIFDHDSSKDRHKEVNDAIKNNVNRFNNQGQIAQMHVFHPFLEKDWNLQYTGENKVEHIIEEMTLWDKTNPPAKYEEFRDIVYTFAKKAHNYKFQQLIQQKK